ncbi:hypothetical protein FLL96_07775 [Vibrio cholerae]|nr:hypothetical protein FLL96_07775 [Vibrio cholerae]TQP36276.1 hypothetical protein FLL93_05455 [Vibrio cholerae]
MCCDFRFFMLFSHPFVSLLILSVLISANSCFANWFLKCICLVIDNVSRVCLWFSIFAKYVSKYVKKGRTLCFGLGVSIQCQTTNRRFIVTNFNGSQGNSKRTQKATLTRPHAATSHYGIYYE